jgi:hypothetical protein
MFNRGTGIRRCKPMAVIALLLVGITTGPTLNLLAQNIQLPTPLGSSASSEAENQTLPQYIPPRTKPPRARVGGVTRGSLGSDPNVLALVPDHVGFTIKQEPKLYWYISQATTLPTIFTLREDEAVRPIVEVPLRSPQCPGIHAVRLKDFGVELKEDISYRWYISIQRDRDSPSQDIVTGGMIERISIVEALFLFPGFTDESDPVQLAKAGLWYDAIRIISDRIESSPSDSTLRRQRAALLMQVGLTELAELDLHPNGESCQPTK